MTISYSKHAGFVDMVPTLIVKLVPADLDKRMGFVVGRSLEVLQVTFNCPDPPSAAFCVIEISLFAVTAVVFTWHVAPVAFVAQENMPARADPQDATEGLAGVPTPLQFDAVVTVADVAAPETLILASALMFPKPSVVITFVQDVPPSSVTNHCKAGYVYEPGEAAMQTRQSS